MVVKELVKKYEDVLNKPFSEFTDKDWKRFEKFLSELPEAEQENED